MKISASKRVILMVEIVKYCPVKIRKEFPFYNKNFTLFLTKQSSLETEMKNYFKAFYLLSILLKPSFILKSNSI